MKNRQTNKPQAEPPVNGELPVYYDEANRSGYWMPAKGKKWVRVGKGDIQTYLQLRHRVSKEQIPGCILRIQQEQFVRYAGPLAGRQAGPIRTKQGLILVTEGYRLLEPRTGSWSFIRRLLEERLDGDAIHFYAWLKIAYEDLRAGRRTPGLLLCLVGPPDMHKTCTQELIITGVLGGRRASPEHYFCRSTDFNGEFAAAEHLIISDPEARGNYDGFNDKLKQLCGTATHRIHFKFKTAFEAEVFWRCSLSCNDNPSDITRLPDLSNPTVKEKVLLLKFAGREFGSSMPGDRESIKARIREELPAFIQHLVQLSIPAKLRARRFGQQPYLNAGLLQSYFEVTREAGLLDLIDTVLFPAGPYQEPVWEGRLKELEEALNTSPEAARRLSRLGAEGQMLARCYTN